MTIDGRAIAKDILAGLRARRADIARPVRLGIIVNPGDSVIESFVRIKAKIAAELDIELVRRDITTGTSEEAMDAVREHSRITDGIIVQLPLPKTIDVNAVISEIPLAKDVDGISTLAGEHSRIVHAPVALAIEEILLRAGVNVAGKRAVVVGAGRLVGVPTADMLERLGANVARYTLDEGRIEDLLHADIVVLGAGEPHFIKPEHIKKGVVLIDAGTSESAGVIMGDADPSCADVASIFTPVPGGVGPVAVAMIFKNVLDLAEHAH